MNVHDAYTRSLSAEDAEKVKFFLQGMLNRMAISQHKYGHVSESYPSKYVAVDQVEHHIRAYEQDLNLEHLIDAANYLMIEFLRPSVEGAYFYGTDSDGSIGRFS